MDGLGHFAEVVHREPVVGMAQLELTGHAAAAEVERHMARED